MVKALTRRRALVAGLVIGTAIIYYFTNRQTHSSFDYTLRFATAMIHGHLGVDEPPPSWLSEMVPYRGHYYAGFPLGAVLSIVPVALTNAIGLTQGFPSAAIVAVLAGASVYFLFGLTGIYENAPARRVMLSLFPMFATWTWCNLAFGGTWHITLGFALVGQAGALYFLLVKRRPLAAGLFFAMAFGNRTEILLTAPLFLYLLLETGARAQSGPEQLELDLWGDDIRMKRRLRRPEPGEKFPARLEYAVRTGWRAAALFLLIPFVLGACTMAYNYGRFGSASDFGNSRIPGILQEPWYRHGIFSVHAIPGNAKAMLWNTWKRIPRYPYLSPDGFGESIFLSCPLLLLLFRKGARDPGIKWTAWTAVAVLTLVLWIHGNTGGWQYSYRYATELLPWMLLIMLECGRPRWAWIECGLFGISVAINAWATYLFLWTNYVRP